MEESFTSNINIVLYIASWIVTIIAYQRKKKHFDVGSLILFSYFLYSIVSLVLFNITDNTFNTFNRIYLFPFIYLYLMLMLATLPILKYDNNKIKEIQKPNPILLNTISIIFIIASLANLPSIIADFSEGLIKLLISTSGGQELYDNGMVDSDKIGDGSISNLPAIISSAMSGLGTLLLFYYLTLRKYNKFIVIGLFLSCIVGILTSISRGQRGGIIETLFVMIISYFALRKFIPLLISKRIKVIGIFIVLLVAVPLIALTTSRFGDGESDRSEDSFYSYVGQANLYFNNYGLDDGGIRYGDRTFLLFKRMLGFDDVPNNFMERRQKYQHLKINDEVFYTFVGDFTIDFGPFVAPLIFIFFTVYVLNKTRIRNGRMLFHQLILLHFVMTVCMLGGIKFYCFSDVSGNLQLIVYFIAFICFRLDCDKTRYQKRETRYNLKTTEEFNH